MSTPEENLSNKIYFTGVYKDFSELRKEINKINKKYINLKQYILRALKGSLIGYKITDIPYSIKQKKNRLYI